MLWFAATKFTKAALDTLNAELEAGNLTQAEYEEKVAALA